MRIYLDTSVIVKLYLKEPESRKIEDWIKKANEATPFTPFHGLEFVNAIQLKRVNHKRHSYLPEYYLSESC